MREAEIEKYLVKKVKELGGEVRKVKWVGRRGAPDRLVMFGLKKAFCRLCTVISDAEDDPGRYLDEAAILRELLGLTSVWVELKAPGKKPEPHQVREHKRMQAMGQRVVVIDSIELVDELLGA